MNLWIKKSNGICVPILGGVGYEHFGNNEVWMGALLFKLKEYYSANLFVDVGANVGQTLLQVLAINRKQHYYGFEPNPSCVHYLLELIRINKFKNVTIYPVALSDNSGPSTLKMYTDSTTDSTASLIQDFRESQTGESNVMVLAGNCISFEKKIGLIKIDVEGSELEVLQGLATFIGRDRPLIICEVLPAYDAGNINRITRQSFIQDLLKKVGYIIFHISTTGALTSVEHFGVHDDIKRINYMFCPSEFNFETNNDD